MAKQTKTATAAPDPVSRTSAGLREALFQEIDAIRDGTSNPTRANAVAKLATGISDTVRMEIEVSKHMQNAADMAHAVSVSKTPEPLKLS